MSSVVSKREVVNFERAFRGGGASKRVRLGITIRRVVAKGLFLPPDSNRIFVALAREIAACDRPSSL